MRIAVIGSGHGGCATAAHLSRSGNEVVLFKLSQSQGWDNFNAVRDNGGLYVRGIKGEGFARIQARDRDDIAIISEFDTICVNYVANYHDHVAACIAPHVRGGQIVMYNPGYLGTLVLRRAMAQVNNHSSVTLIEFETLPFSSRITAPGEITIFSENLAHPCAIWPAEDQVHALDLVGTIAGRCELRNNAFEVSLHNPNMIIHTVGVLLNPTRVESPHCSFALYKDGFSPGVWSIVAALDEEKKAVLRCLGCQPRSYFDEFRLRTFGHTDIDSARAFSHYADEAPGGPHSLNHRYLTEDVPKGLGLLQTLGRLCRVSTPVCDGLITLAETMLPQAQIRDQIEESSLLIEEYYRELSRGSSSAE